MFTNIKNGWCNFQFGEFIGHPSYITDVPIDVLDCLSDYKTKGYGVCEFDEEGSSFFLILAFHECYVIERKDEPVLYHRDFVTEDIYAELLSDIEDNIDIWAAWMCGADNSEISANRKVMEEKIKKIKQAEQL